TIVDLAGSGSGTTLVNDSSNTGSSTLTVNGTNDADGLTVTAGQVALGTEIVNYAGVTALQVDGLAGADEFSLTGGNPSTAVTLDAGADSGGFAGAVAGDLDGALSLVNFSGATLQVGGDFNGQLTSVAQDAGTGALDSLSVDGDLAGSVSAESVGAVSAAA